MTFAQEFIAFTENLDPKAKAEVSEIMLELMAKHTPKDWQLSPEQEAESERRFNDPNPKLADPAEVNALLGHDIAS